MEYIPIVLTVAAVHLLAVMSPGPDFVMVSRNSLMYSRRNGVFSAIGLGAGILVHVVYSMVGIGLLISQSVVLFNILKILGAAYLIYIGIKSLRAKPNMTESGAPSQHHMSDAAALRMGFITNVTNPKATLFFLSLFTLVITPATPLFVKMVMGLEMAVATAAWFGLVAVMLSHRRIKQRFTHVQHWVERVMGAVLIGLGIKIAVSSK